MFRQHKMFAEKKFSPKNFFTNYFDNSYPYFLFLLPIHQFQIQFRSISDPIHIHFRSNSYQLNIYELLCVSPVFNPNPKILPKKKFLRKNNLLKMIFSRQKEFLPKKKICWKKFLQIKKYISNSYSFQIKIISITYTIATK